MVPVPLVAGKPLQKKLGADRAEEHQVADLMRAVGVGVSVERAAIGAGIPLPRLAELMSEFPALRVMLAKERGKLEIQVHQAMLSAAQQGKHMAAIWLVERIRSVEDEIDTALLAARAGTEDELTDDEVRARTDRYFADGD